MLWWDHFWKFRWERWDIFINHFYSLSRSQPLHFNFFPSSGWVPFLCQCVSMATERQVGGEAAGTRLSVFRYRPQESPQESWMADCPLMQHDMRKWRAGGRLYEPTVKVMCLVTASQPTGLSFLRPGRQNCCCFNESGFKNGHFIEHQIPLQCLILLELWSQKIHPDSFGYKCYCWPSAKEKKPGSGAITTAFQNASQLLSEHISLLWATGPLTKCVYLPCTSRKTSLLSHFEGPPPPFLLSLWRQLWTESFQSLHLHLCWLSVVTL